MYSLKTSKQTGLLFISLVLFASCGKDNTVADANFLIPFITAGEDQTTRLGDLSPLRGNIELSSSALEGENGWKLIDPDGLDASGLLSEFVQSTTETADGQAIELKTSFTATKVGTYTATLFQVVDDLRKEDEVLIEVTPPDLIVSAGPDVSINENESIQLNGSAQLPAVLSQGLLFLTWKVFNQADVDVTDLVLSAKDVEDPTFSSQEAGKYRGVITADYEDSNVRLDLQAMDTVCITVNELETDTLVGMYQMQQVFEVINGVETNIGYDDNLRDFEILKGSDTDLYWIRGLDLAKTNLSNSISDLLVRREAGSGSFPAYLEIITQQFDHDIENERSQLVSGRIDWLAGGQIKLTIQSEDFSLQNPPEQFNKRFFQGGAFVVDF